MLTILLNYSYGLRIPIRLYRSLEKATVLATPCQLYIAHKSWEISIAWSTANRHANPLL